MYRLGKKHWKAILASIIVLFGAGTWLMFKSHAQTNTIAETVPLVRTKMVGMADASQINSYSGEVRGRYESQLAFQIPGKIIKRNVEAGTVVKPGDLLIQIDARDMQEAASGSQAQLISAEAQLKFAADNWQRYKQLYEQNAVSKAEYDRYLSAYESAEAMVMQARAQANTGTNKLEYTSLYAETAGVIAEVNAEVGQVVGAGQKVMTLVSDNELEIEINVPENRLSELKNTKNIKVAFWALTDVCADGIIREVSPIADKISRTYKVRIALPAPPAEIKLGMTAKVTIYNNSNTSNNKIVYIPLSAVYQTHDTPCVWVVKEELVQLKPVKLGVFGDNQVQVLEGLQYGDVIVTAGVHKLQEGQKVRAAGDTHE